VLTHLFAIPCCRPFGNQLHEDAGNSSVTFLPRVGILRGLWHKNFSCVFLTALRSIVPQRRSRQRQLRFGVDPKMKSADAGAQKKEVTL
jgi:hypothetical protein